MTYSGDADRSEAPEPAASSDQRSDDSGRTGPAAPDVDTVEALVRRQMAQSLGGRRGMLEAGLPGIGFTVLWLITKDLTLALITSAALAGIALVIRLVQRSTMQYVGNAIFAVVIGWGVVRLAESMGSTEQEAALMFFLPGILISLGYTILMSFSCLVGWPFFGFLLGTVTGDPTAWHKNRQIVALCTRLTWLFLAPGALGVLIQGPILLLGWTGAMDQDLAVLLLGILRTGLGWALRIACYGAMIWLLARNHTPLEHDTSPA